MRILVVCMCLLSSRKTWSARSPWLLDDLGDDACADGLAALADGEALLLLERDGPDELDRDLHVVTRHHHLDLLGELDRAGHVGRAHVELRAVVREERLVTAAF